MIKIFIIDKGEVIQERHAKSVSGAKLQVKRNEPRYCGCAVIWDGENVYKREYYRGNIVSRYSGAHWTSYKLHNGAFEQNFRLILAEQMKRWAKHEQYFTGE